MNKKNTFYKAVLSLTLATAFFSPATNAAKEYSFGIVPQTNGSKLSKLWSPILKYLEENSEIDLRFATTRNIDTFEKRLVTGKYDIVYMNPYHYTVFMINKVIMLLQKLKRND